MGYAELDSDVPTPKLRRLALNATHLDSLPGSVVFRDDDQDRSQSEELEYSEPAYVPKP